MFRFPEVEEAVACLGETINNVRSENLNLSESEKELLKWHYRLGHLSFRRIQALLRTGVFSHTEASRLYIVLHVTFAILQNVLPVYMANKVLALFLVTQQQSYEM